MSIVDIIIPSPGESITEVEIGSWLKADGDYVQVDETICEIETDKATLPLIADNTGTLKIVLQEGDTAAVGDVACSIDTTGTKPESAQVEKSSPETVKFTESSESAKVPLKQAPDAYADGHPSPAARKLMAESGITSANTSFVSDIFPHRYATAVESMPPLSPKITPSALFCETVSFRNASISCWIFV